MTTQNPNPNKEDKTKMTKKTTFAGLLRHYEQTARTPDANPDAYAKALTDLATAVAYSVLKKCIDTSQNKALLDVRRSMARDTAMLDNINYASANAYTMEYTADGDTEQKTVDSDLADALAKLMRQSLGDGLDLINDAIIAILDETRNSADISDGWLERPYAERHLKRKVRIKVEDSANGWETVEITPIQAVYRAVRHSIETSRAMQTDPRNGYTYLADIATDAESGAEDVIYRRLPKYADLGGRVVDANGRETAYTGDEQTVTDIDELVERLNLTARQAKILQLRLCGYGKKAIATYLGISVSSVSTQMRRMQDKANDLL